jgi:transcriptional regulator with XRE-family HTH domain
MLEQALTTDVCRQIITHLLRKRRWTISRIARVIGGSTDYVRRIQKREQSFQMRDVEALAKACRLPPYRLIFNSLNRNRFEPGLYDLAVRELESHEEFQRALMRKPSKVRRSRTTAA